MKDSVSCPRYRSPLVCAFALVLFTCFGTFGNAEADDPGICEASFSRRAEDVSSAFAAAECFLVAGASEAAIIRAERALSYAVLNSKLDGEKIEAIRRGLYGASELIFQGLPSGQYWLAVFTTFEAQHEDRGAIIPRHILAKIPEIQRALKSADEGAPRTHFSGPKRVLGIQLISTPGIVGGDLKRGTALLREAYAADPEYLLNGVWVAKALLKQRDTAGARKILEKIAATAESEFLADHLPESRGEVAEAKKILQQIR